MRIYDLVSCILYTASWILRLLMKAYIISSSNCTRRRLDTSRLKEYFLSNGYKLSRSASSADIIIVVTCAFIRETEDLSLDMVIRYSQNKGRLIVAGCLPAINPQQLNTVFSGSTIPTHSLENIDDYFPQFKVKFAEIMDANRASGAVLFPSFNPGIYWRKISRNPAMALTMFNKKRRTDRAWAKNYYIRTSWGCRGKCSYCVIRRAIGPLKSKPIADCAKELIRGLEQGFNTFLLDGDDLGAYGLDVDSTLPELIRNLISIQGHHTLRLESLNPLWLVQYSKELTSLVLSNRISSIECCIQSGSKRILELMDRYADPSKMLAVLLDIKSANPSTLFSTQIIVGFPSETEIDFENTIEIVEKVGFESVVIFRYQENEKCRAASLREKVPPEVIENRIRGAYRRLSCQGVDVLCI